MLVLGRISCKLLLNILYVHIMFFSVSNGFYNFLLTGLIYVEFRKINQCYYDYLDRA